MVDNTRSASPVDLLQQFVEEQQNPSSSTWAPAASTPVSQAVPQDPAAMLRRFASGQPEPPAPPSWTPTKETGPEDYKNVSWPEATERFKKNWYPNLQQEYGDFLSSIAGAVEHPGETLEGVRKVGAGAVNYGLEAMGADPQSVRNLAGKLPFQKPHELTPDELAEYDREKQAAKAAWHGITDPLKEMNPITYQDGKLGYDPSGLKYWYAEKPMSALTATSLPFTGMEKGLGAAGSVARMADAPAIAKGMDVASKTANIASRANPVGVAGEATGLAIQGAGLPLAFKGKLLGGIPMSTFYDAYGAGKEGSMSYLGGFLNAPSEYVYSRAQDAAQKFSKQRRADYVDFKNDLINASHGAGPVDYNPIIASVDGMLADKFDPLTGQRNYSPEALKLHNRLMNEISTRMQVDPNKHPLAHTPTDLDDFKKHFYDTYQPAFDKLGMSHNFNDIYSSIKNEIQKKYPKYNDAMSHYAGQSDDLGNIMKQFQLDDPKNKKIAIDRLMRASLDNPKSYLGELSQYDSGLPQLIAGKRANLFSGPANNAWGYAVAQGIDEAGRGDQVRLPVFNMPQIQSLPGYTLGAGKTLAQRYAVPAALEKKEAERNMHPYEENYPLQNAGGRIGRASGGKVDHKSAEAISDQLVAAFARAKKGEDLESKVLLNKPDDVIIDALKEAKKAI
jgi:hypothetical protein